MKCVLWNARSLNNKLHHLTTILNDGELDIAIITETWFRSQANNCTAILRENDYSIFHFNRDDKAGGGVAVIFRNWFKSNGAKSYNFKSFECISVPISSNASHKINFVVVL